MAKIISVEKARKDQGTCYRSGCTTEIKAGDSYRHVTLKTGPRSSIRRVFCTAHHPRPSEITTSRLGEVYAIQEGAEDQLNGCGCRADVLEVLENTASEAESYRDEFQSSLDNMPEGLQNGGTGQLIQERIDALQTWQDELESARDTIENDNEAVGDEADTETLCSTCDLCYSAHVHPDPESDKKPCEKFITPDDLESAVNQASDAIQSLEIS